MVKFRMPNIDVHQLQRLGWGGGGGGGDLYI